MGGTELNLMENSSSPIKEEEEEPAKKKCDTEFTSLVLYFYCKNREIFISRCSQESSIIEQCLATKCKVHRNPLVFS